MCQHEQPSSVTHFQSDPAAAPSLNEDAEFSVPITDPAALKQFFQQEGYAVVRNAVPKTICEQAKQAFNRDVKSDKRFFMRHESSAFERHVYTEAGFMKYPIMNIQDLSGRKPGEFRRLGLEILTHPHIQDVTTTLLGEKGKIIHTMYFDGNQKTWAHRDSHYIDSEQTGRMIGVWVAAEDIHPGAGRFFVHARSHRTPTPTEWRLDEADPNGRQYKERIAEFASRFRRVAPALRQGDVIVWSSLTIHGSLETTAPGHSRRSFTAHYIPASHQYLWLRREPGSHAATVVHGVEIALHEDQLRPSVQLTHLLRTDFPRLHKLCARVNGLSVGSKRWVRENFPGLHRLYRACKR